MAPRVDFKTVRATADFVRILAHYNIDLARDGSKPGQFKALCPFHDDQKPSLKINTERNIFHCFVCEAKGNVLDFIAQLDDIEIRAAALKASDLSGLEPAPASTTRARRATASAPPPPAETTEQTPNDSSSTANPPLSFELKLGQDDALTNWLANRGITPDQSKTFGLGRASSKSKTIGHHLAIPLHNEPGQLIGYCGRYIGDDQADDQPKYVLPKGFRKERELFNLHRVPPAPKVLVLFESYLSVIKFHDHIACVSSFGRSISTDQVAAIFKLQPHRVIVAFDGDEPGQTGATAVVGALATHVWVRALPLSDGQKPHHLAWEELRQQLLKIW